MKRFNPIATPGCGSGATVTVAPEEVETRPVTERYERRGRWRSRHAPRTTRHVTVITLAPNPAQNGLQIYFPGKPDEAVRTELKAAGRRWSSWNVSHGPPPSSPGTTARPRFGARPSAHRTGRKRNARSTFRAEIR